MNQTWENSKALNLRPDFGRFGPSLPPPKIFSWVLALVDVRHCHKISSYAILRRKTYNPNSRKWHKNSFWAWFRSVGPKFGSPIFFSKIWLRQLLDIMVSYHHEYHIKLMIHKSSMRKNSHLMKTIGKRCTSIYSSQKYLSYCHWDVSKFKWYVPGDNSWSFCT